MLILRFKKLTEDQMQDYDVDVLQYANHYALVTLLY